MAFYQSNHYYESSSYYDSSEYASTPYYATFNSIPYQDSDSNNNSTHQFNQDQVFSYFPTPDSTASTCCRISYSAAAFTPNYVTLYDKSPDSHPSQTQFIISDFNDPEFEEYDPKPYCGGYDIAATYGEPLPPSDKTCYPRSGTSLVDPIPLPATELVPATAFEPQSQPRDLVQEEDTRAENENDGSEVGSRIDEPSGESGYYEHGKQIAEQVPPGYGLEAIDICESLFGPWPCLTRSYRRGQDQGVGDYGGHGNHWNVAAVDYLFGSSDPYAGRDSGLMSYEDGVYAYQRGY